MRLLAVISASMVWIGSAQAAQDSDWPCVQRKVENMSHALMWPHQIGEDVLDSETSRHLQDLVDRLSLRRTDFQEAEELLRRFRLAFPGADKGVAGLLFVRIFERLDKDRLRVVRGIVRYAREQTGLSEKILAARREMVELDKGAEPDFDRMDMLEEQIDWDERIYRDRTQSLGYLCETPALIEKRVWGLARLLEKHWP